MKFNKKHYNVEKVKYYIKNQKLFFLFETTDLNTRNWLKIEQNFKKCNLKFYKFNNTSLKRFLKNSIFKHLSSTINGPLKLVFIKNKEKHFKTLEDFRLQNSKQNFQFFFVKLNNKIYSNLQLKKLKNYNYKTNLYNLQNNLNKNLYKNVAKLIKGSE